MFFALLAVPILVVITQELDTSALTQVYTYQNPATGEMINCAFGSSIFDASWQEIVLGVAWGTSKTKVY